MVKPILMFPTRDFNFVTLPTWGWLCYIAIIHLFIFSLKNK